MYKVGKKTKDTVKSEYVKYMLYLFEETSKDVFPDTIRVPNESWFDYIDSVYKVCKQKIPKKVVDWELPVFSFKGSDKDIILSFSGGADSTTYAQCLKDFGYNVVLYSLFNLNRSVRSENTNILRVAKFLGMDLVNDSIVFSGKSEYLESPVKNHLIASFMIPFMVDRGISNISLGIFSDDLSYCNYKVIQGVSDYYDIFRLFEKAIRSTFYNFNLIVLFKNLTHRAAYTLLYHKELVNYYQSCLTPDYLRKSFRKLKDDKYKISLPDNRCMTCWKCALEYCFLTIFKIIEPDKRYISEVVPRVFFNSYHIENKQRNKDMFDKILHEYISYDDFYRYMNDKESVLLDIRKVMSESVGGNNEEGITSI